jgi:hypothetical protein
MTTTQTEDGGALAARDSREIITPEAFQVAPGLYGLPLANPWRRLAAIGIDALIVSLLAQAGGFLLAVAAAVLFYSWMRSRGQSAGFVGRGLRATVALFGAVVVFVAAVSVLQPLWERVVGDEDDRERPQAALSGRDAAVAGVGVARLLGCADAQCRAHALDGLIETLARSDMPPDERREMLVELIDGAAATADERRRLRDRMDTTLAAARPQDAPALAQPEDAPEEQEQAEPRVLAADGDFSVLRTLKALAADLGFSVGWGAVYFTLLTVLWNGQTLGKRWLGIRVIALSGKPLRYRDAFDRYGGYAAGFATGLIGFLQVFWDPNRQAIHDRIAFTAVIRDGGSRAPQQAPEAAAGS